MSTELSLNPLREIDRFILLMMQASMRFACELKVIVHPQVKIDNLKTDLLRRFDVLELEEIYSAVGQPIEDAQALKPYLRVMFEGSMVDSTRLENFGQLGKAIACLMICSLADQDFDRRFFQCWIMADKNPGLDLASQARRRLYSRLAAGEVGALSELSQQQARMSALENRQRT